MQACMCWLLHPMQRYAGVPCSKACCKGCWKACCKETQELHKTKRNWHTGVDADDAAGGIQQGPAAVARIDGRVRLDRAADAAAQLALDLPPQPAHHPCSRPVPLSVEPQHPMKRGDEHEMCRCSCRITACMHAPLHATMSSCRSGSRTPGAGLNAYYTVCTSQAFYPSRVCTTPAPALPRCDALVPKACQARRASHESRACEAESSTLTAD